MAHIIAFVLGNFTLTFFILGLVASAIALWCARPPRTFAVIVEAHFIKWSPRTISRPAMRA
jgi:hypothetical protein